MPQLPSLPPQFSAMNHVFLKNVPEISDITICMKILQTMGADVQLINKNTVQFDTRGIKNPRVPYDMARSMRASSYFLGTLLGRFHEAYVAMPGGCDLGDRPIDQHLKAFRNLGAVDELKNGEVHCFADQLIGSQIYFDFNTVGGTINAILASVKAKGRTIIENAAKEPHIVDLANFLNSMGADIQRRRYRCNKNQRRRLPERYNISDYSRPD